MDGLCRSLGRPVLFDAGCGCAAGMHLLRPLTLGVLASCESFLTLRRVTLGERVEDVADALGMPDSARNELRWRAHDEMRKDKAHRVVKAGDVFRWLYTREGAAHSLYWCFRGSRCPAAAGVPQAAGHWRDRPEAWRRAFLRARDHVSGIDQLANLDWPQKEAARRSGGREKFHPWRRVIRFLSQEYRIDPLRAARLTLYSLNVFQCEDAALGGTSKVGMAELPDSAFADGRKRPADRTGRRRPGGDPEE